MCLLVVVGLNVINDNDDNDNDNDNDNPLALLGLCK
jgi:hypothetical protein